MESPDIPILRHSTHTRHTLCYNPISRAPTSDSDRFASVLPLPLTPPQTTRLLTPSCPFREGLLGRGHRTPTYLEPGARRGAAVQYLRSALALAVGLQVAVAAQFALRFLIVVLLAF